MRSELGQATRNQPSFSYLVASGLPKRLHNKLSSRARHLPKASEVTLGPDDSWFVRWEGGKAEWDLPSDISDVCNSAFAAGGEVTRVSLFSEDNYLVRSTASVSGRGRA